MNKQSVNPIRTKIELEQWARRVLIDAMLAGIPFAALAKTVGVSSEKLSAFACFGARIEEAELKRIFAHMSEAQDMETSQFHEKAMSLYGANWSDEKPTYRNR